MRQFRVDCLEGSVQAWQPHSPGLQVSPDLGDEVPICSSSWGRWQSLPGTAARDSAGSRDDRSRRVDQLRPCAHAGADSTELVGIARSTAIEGSLVAQVAQRVRHLAQALRGQHLWARGYWVATSGNVTDEMWVEYTRTRPRPSPKTISTLPEGAPVRRRADRSGLEP